MADFVIRDGVLIKYTGYADFVTIPEGITEIAEGAFEDCVFLKKVSVPKNLTKIAANAFRNCRGLVNQNGMIIVNHILVACVPDLASNYYGIVIPNGVTRLNDYCFKNCNFKKVIIPTSVETIGKGAFSDCTNLLHVELPHGLIAIEDHTFARCTSLALVKIPDSVRVIGDGAFAYCEALTGVKLPKALVEVHDNAFKQCYNLSKLAYEGTNRIRFGNNVFFLDDKLCNGNGFITYGDTLFYSARRKREIKIHSSIKHIAGYAFNFNNNIEQIVIPDGVQTIGASAFCNCWNLSRVVLPKSLKCIGASAFVPGCAIRGITIPDEVEDIAADAFDINLEYMIYKPTVPFEETGLDETYSVVWSMGVLKYFADRHEVNEAMNGVVSDLLKKDANDPVKLSKWIDRNYFLHFVLRHKVLKEEVFNDLLNLPRIKENQVLKKAIIRAKEEQYPMEDVLKGFADMLDEECEKALKTSDFSSSEYLDKEWTWIDEDDDCVTLLLYKGASSEVVVPDFIEGKRVIGLARRTFYTFFQKTHSSHNSRITSIVIPDGVEKLDSELFLGCYNLRDVYIPASVRTIMKDTFTSVKSKITIHCVFESYAEEFAKNNGIRCTIGR